MTNSSLADARVSPVQGTVDVPVAHGTVSVFDA